MSQPARVNLCSKIVWAYGPRRRTTAAAIGASAARRTNTASGRRAKKKNVEPLAQKYRERTHLPAKMHEPWPAYFDPGKLY